MSSATPHGRDAAASSSASTSAANEYYFCHRCCLAALLATADVCPLCGSAFLEKIDIPPYLSLIPPELFPFLPISSFFHSPASFDLCSPADVAALFHSDISPLRPLISYRIFAEDQMERLISLGTNVHTVVMGMVPPAPDAPSEHLSLNYIRKYAHQILDNELVQSRNVFVTAASESVIAALPNIEIIEATASSETRCAMCRERFAVGEKVTQLPCTHFFHQGCIIPWLLFLNTCPECRFQLPTKDEHGLGSTVVFMIVIVPPSWYDPLQRTVIVQRRVLGRLILPQIRGAQRKIRPTETTRREELQPH